MRRTGKDSEGLKEKIFPFAFIIMLVFASIACASGAEYSASVIAYFIPVVRGAGNEDVSFNVTVLSTTLEIRNQTASQSITSISFLGASGDTVTNPYNNNDTSPQNISTTTPVVTIYNPSGSSYNIFLKVTAGTGWTGVISDERFNVTDDDTNPNDASTWKSLKSWGDIADSGVTVAPGTHKDLYLAFYLKGSGTGNSTLSVYGEPS